MTKSVVLEWIQYLLMGDWVHIDNGYAYILTVQRDDCDDYDVFWMVGCSGELTKYSE